MSYNLDSAIRKVENFPYEGILFYDITSIISNTQAFSFVIEKMIHLYENSDITHIIAVESRGFLFAAPLAHKLKIPIILARKKGKLPNKTLSQSYDLEYGSETLEIQELDIQKGMKTIIVDDLIATGGTLEATASMLASKDVEIEALFSVIGLPFLNYKEKLSGFKVDTLIEYHSEEIN